MADTAERSGRANSDIGKFSLSPKWIRDSAKEIFDAGGLFEGNRRLRVRPSVVVMVYGILAEHAHKDDDYAWPGNATIASEVSVGASTVRRAKAVLKKIGAIETWSWSTKSGAQTSNLYRVNAANPGTTRVSMEGQARCPRVDRRAGHGWTPNRNKPNETYMNSLTCETEFRTSVIPRDEEQRAEMDDTGMAVAAVVKVDRQRETDPVDDFVRCLEVHFNHGRRARGERLEDFLRIAEEAVDENLSLDAFDERARRYVMSHPTARADYLVVERRHRAVRVRGQPTDRSDDRGTPSADIG
jgi:hypothetical protein